MIKEITLLFFLQITVLPDVVLHENIVPIIKDIQKVHAGKLTITSNYRNNLINKKYNGVWNSKHLKGKAVDIRLRGLNRESIYNILKLKKLGYTVLIKENHIHIGIGNLKNK